MKTVVKTGGNIFGFALSTAAYVILCIDVVCLQPQKYTSVNSRKMQSAEKAP